MSDAAGTIQQDVPHDSFDDDADDEGVNAFLSMLEDDAKRPSEGKPEATVSKANEAAQEDDTSTTTDETAEQSDDESEESAEDEPKMVVKVDGEERQVPVKDLARLYGQEAALTRKSQELAAARTVADTTASKATVVLSKLAEKARATLEPFEKLDWLRLSHETDKATWEQLRSDALEAQSNYKFLTEELDGHMRAEAERVSANQREVANATLATLSASVEKGGIEGWNQQLYTEMMDYATTLGIPKERALGLVDVGPLRMLHKAMLYDRGQASARSAAEKVAKAKQAPSRVARPGGAAAPAQKGKVADAIAKLRQSGSDDDGIDAWLALDNRD